jgi:flavin-dependent dehydrogenase
MAEAPRDSCDVLVVGGGPAGSTCAWRLRRAGLDVIVLDRVAFPRDKVCAGWITPAVVDALELDLEDYARQHTLQPFTGFRTGGIAGPMRLTDFGGTVSYGIRRCEFDHYLLARSGARLLTGQPLGSLRRDGATWVANDRISARVVVGAGGHFCPVARQLHPDRELDAVVAQEIEFALPADGAGTCPVRGECPELFFWPDLQGYGWCVRKGDYLNIGAGRLRQAEFPAAVREFSAALAARGLVPGDLPHRWRGHAYLLYRHASRALHGEGILLVGDAAGLALAPSGEGILTAVESGLIAATTLVELGAPWTRARLALYAQRIAARFGPRRQPDVRPGEWPGWLTPVAAQALLGIGWMTKRFVLEEGFLHPRRPRLA